MRKLLGLLAALALSASAQPVLAGSMALLGAGIGRQGVAVEYLVVAGGGPGGPEGFPGITGGGGGGGGVLTGSVVLNPASYAITVGDGALGGSRAPGGNSSFDSIAVALGGGYGGDQFNLAGAGGPGGSGGGAYEGGGTAGVGTVGQGYDGGGGGAISNSYGGGGAGGAATTNVGGPGVSSSITTAPVTYAAGGGGAGISAGDGGSGIVIIRYLSAVPLATGCTITASGGYQIHSCTVSTTFTVN